MKRLAAIALVLAAIMPFSNPIVGGNDTLIRDKIQSENFVAGTSGWRIQRNGDAEFNNLLARGSLTTGPPGTEHVEISNTPGKRIAFYTGEALETDPGAIDVDYDSGTDEAFLNILGPSVDGNPRPGISLSSFPPFNNRIVIDAQEISLTGTPMVTEPVRNETTWTAIPRVNSWVDFAGGRAEYLLDAAGIVHFRGQIASGTAAGIATMPAGYRPSQSMEWIMRGVGGVTMCAVLVTNAGVVSVSANLGTAQASGIRLDSIRYPIF